MTRPTPGSPAEGTTETPETAAGQQDGEFTEDIGAKNIGDAFRRYVAQVRGGELGALPALGGVIVLLVVFANANSVFLSRGNFANFLTQAAPTALLAMGLIFVLLLGEIDLSAGTASGVCASTMALSLAHRGDLAGSLGRPTYLMLLVFLLGAVAITVWFRLWIPAGIVALGMIFILTGLTKHVYVSMFVAIAIGVAIGTLIGYLVAQIGIPSFVVTLALFLAWQGVLLKFIGEGAAIATKDHHAVFALENENLATFTGWALWIVAMLGYAGYTLTRAIRRRRNHLVSEPLDLVILRIVALAATTGLAVALLSQNRSKTVFAEIRGIPYAVPLVAVVFILWSLVLAKSRYGRFVYATGGNAEAARRAGIDVTRVRLSVFIICSGMAGLAGIVQSSKQGAVDAAFGNGTTLLYAVGAAVIGGTSLFGGRGKVRDAVIGALVIAMIPNGLGLLRNLDASYEFLLTGLVLLLAASVDALSRKRTSATGR
jgi:D-xylose transport system permease protein